MKCTRCGEHSARKHGLYRNKAGFHQKWKCRSCGTTWHDETVLNLGESKEVHKVATKEEKQDEYKPKTWGGSE